MQPFPYRNAEQKRDEAREEKSTHARRERGLQDFLFKGGKERIGQRKTDGQELVISSPPLYISMMSTEVDSCYFAKFDAAY